MKSFRVIGRNKRDKTVQYDETIELEGVETKAQIAEVVSQLEIKMRMMHLDSEVSYTEQ